MKTPIIQLNETMQGYQAACVLGAAAELDIFHPILDAPKSASQIADAIKSDERATVIFLDALASLGFLIKNDGKYSVPKDFLPLLDSNSPSTFLPMLRHQMTCVRSWAQLAWILKNGHVSTEIESINGSEADFLAFIQAMNSIAEIGAAPLVEKMKTMGLLNFTHLLDVGGASGTYTRAFLNAMPNIVATLFDVPPAVEEARRKFVAPEHKNRVNFVAGDFYTDELPTGADFVWLSAIIHQMNRPMSVELYKKIHRALCSGGRLAIRDVFVNEDRISPRSGAMFAVNMLARTECGMTYTISELTEDLHAAGFKNVRHAVISEDMNGVVFAEK